MAEPVRPVPELLTEQQRRCLRSLLEQVLPYPAIPGGPTVADTLAFVLRRLEHEDRARFGPLEALLDRLVGQESEWLQAASSAVAHPDRLLFETLRGWAWDGFLADPRWGVNRDGLGWSHVGWAGPPRRREREHGDGARP